jgi:UDP-GlcNAc:undecaprenyl-phosphate GlcNAc-1-phosphate transferase
VAVCASFVAVVLAGYWMAPWLADLPWARARAAQALVMLRDAYRVEAKLLAFLAGATLVFGVGLLDDVLQARLPVAVKAAGQVAAAAILVAADVRTSFLPAEWMNSALTLVWLVGMTNAFNLLDNMDGLSAGVACVASSVLLLNAWALGEFFICLLLAAFIGSLLGFLLFNFHPASVFLGDCGSLFVGYVMGSLTLLERYVSHASSTLFPVLMPVLVLAVPIVDSATVVAIRLRERRPIYVGDARHLSHRLVSLGFSQRAAVLFIYLATFGLGLGAALLPHASRGQSALILVQALAFVALLLILLFFERRKVPR